MLRRAAVSSRLAEELRIELGAVRSMLEEVPTIVRVAGSRIEEGRATRVQAMLGAPLKRAGC